MIMLEAKMTAKQRVLKVLTEFALVPSFVLAKPEHGGLRYSARIFELRKDGYDIRWRYQEVNGKKTNTTVYYIQNGKKTNNQIRRVL